MSTKDPPRRSGSWSAARAVYALVVIAVAVAMVAMPVALVGATGTSAATQAAEFRVTDTRAVDGTVLSDDLRNFDAPNDIFPLGVLAAGNPLDVSANVTNYGDVKGTRTVQVELDGRTAVSREVTLAPGETRTVDFSITDTAELCCAEFGVNETVTLGVFAVGEDGQPNTGLESTLTVVPGNRVVRVQGIGGYEIVTNGVFRPRMSTIECCGMLSDGRYLSPDGTMTVEGYVYGDEDEYILDGNIVSVSTDPTDPVYVDPDVRADGHVTVAVDGRVVAGESSTLRFTGDGTKSAYRFEVDGDVISGARLGPADAIRETTARGLVFGGRDIYTFSGDLESVSVVGNATVSLDGEVIDPDDYGETHTIQFVGGEAGSGAYLFAASGAVNRVDSPEGGDLVDQSSVYGAKPLEERGAARGLVTVGYDAFTFTGELQGFGRLGFNGTVLLDDEPINRTDNPVLHEIQFCGNEEGAWYEFTVPGEVVGEGITEQYRDGFDGDSGQGFVSDGTDRYYYTGPREPKSIELGGDVAVSIDGEEIDPETTC